MNRSTLLAVLVGLSSMTASAITFPDAGSWVPVSINAGDGGTTYLGDPTTDGQNNGRNVVGDNLRPAFYIASTATDFLFRLRIDTDPSGPGGLASYGWGILIDSDGDVRDYDYVLMADGIAEEIVFSQKTTKTLAGDPRELANVVLNTTPVSYTQPTQNIAITPVGQGTLGFSGNEDYFLDIAVPLTVFYGTSADGGTTFTRSTPLRFWVGVSNSARAITVDLGGTDQLGAGVLPGTPTIPQVLCTIDTECGGSSSGQVCSNGVCGAGCRGTGGNTCPATQTCTSTTTAVGECVAAGAPVVVAPADGSSTSNKRPVISGTAPANATVDVYVDGVKIGTTTADALGTWSFTPLLDIADGVHTASATATVSGVTSGFAPAHVFSIDSTAPATPTVVSPANNSFIQTASPTITGAAEAGATVKVYIDTVLACTTVATTDPITGLGVYACTVPTSLTAATHQVFVTATDALGNTSGNSNTNTFTVDLTAPTAPVVTAPANNSFTTDTTPTYTGTAEANSTLQLYVDGTLEPATITVDGAGNWSYTPTTPLAAGQHLVRATATDRAGNVSAFSTQNMFTVDVTAPSAPVVTAPANNSFTSDTTPTFSGTAEANSTVTLYLGATLYATVTASAGGAWTYTPTASLSDATYTIKATATDAAGNTSPDSNLNTFTVDTVPPAAPVVTAPASGSVTANTRPAITGTAPANTTVNVFIDGALAGTTTSNGSGAWTFTPVTSLSDGQHAVKATSRDAAGNVSVDSNTNTFTIDSQASNAPVVTGPADGSTTQSTTPAISGTSDGPGLTITIRIDGAVVGTTISGANGAWTFTSPTLTLGAHTVSATATDAAGNLSPSSATNAFTVLPATPGAPTLTEPVDGAITSDTTPTFSGLAEANSTVTVRVDGQVACTTTATAQGTFSCTPAQGLPPGPHVATASASNAGGTSQQSAPTGFIIDTTPPLTPFVVGPAPGSTTTDTTPTITGTGEPGSQVTVRVDGQAIGSATVGADGTWTLVPTTPLALGDHSVSARATDAAGNPSLPSNTNAFSVVAPNPLRPTLDAPADNATLSTATPTFSGTAAPGALVTVVVDGQPVCTATAASDGTWSCAPSQPLSPGLHRATAEVSDGNGGTLASETRSFTVDTTAPSAPVVTAPVEGSSTSDTTPLLEGTAEPLTTVKVYVDGLLMGTTAADANGRWTLTSDALALGAHTVSATATDRAGNTSPLSNLNRFTVAAANGAPVVLGPTAGSVTNDSTPPFSGTAAPDTDVEVLVDGVVVCTARSTASGAWTCTGTTPLMEGPHAVTAREQGSLTTSLPVPFKVDTIAPAAPVITAPAPNSYTSATPTIAGTAEPGARVEVKIDGMAVCVTLADAQGRWSCVAPTPLSEDVHTATATATDVAGNVSPVSNAVPFNVDLTPPGRPTLTAPADGSTITDTTPRYAGTAEANATVTVRVDGVTVCATTADASGAFACEPTTPLARGAHVATASATDAAGNTSAPSEETDFTVVAATPPTPVITAPIGGALLADSTPRISGTAEAGSLVTVRDTATGEVLCTATADASGSWSCDSKPLADGSYGVTATAEKDGGTSLPSDQATFRIDTTPPVVNVEGTPPGPITSSAATTFTWNTEPGTTYQCSVDGGPFEPCTSPLSLSGLAPGEHGLTVRATDEAGNTTETETSWLVEDPVSTEWSVIGGGVSCAALPGEALAPLALVLLSLRRRRR